MRNVAAAVKACLGVVALSWAVTGFGQGSQGILIGQPQAGSQGVIVAHHAPTTGKAPAILILQHQTTLASTCGGSAFDVSTFINVDGFASADVKVTAPGVGQIEEFTDETGANIGPYDAVFPTFHILAFGGGLPPNTPITIMITTYSGSNLAGHVTTVSSLTFDCTTGIVLNAPTATVGEPVPTTSSITLAATAALLLVFGAVALRRARTRSNS